MLNPTPPRYTTRFRNGTWHVFDTQAYMPASARGLFRDADREAQRLNARKQESRRVARH